DESHRLDGRGSHARCDEAGDPGGGSRVEPGQRYAVCCLGIEREQQRTKQRIEHRPDDGSARNARPDDSIRPETIGEMRMRVSRCLKPAVCGAVAVITLLSQTPRAASQPGYAARPEVREFIAELAASDGFNTDVLQRLFASVRFQPAIIAAMARPLIAPPQWHEYAPRFVNPARIEAGVAFWRGNSAVLMRAELAFG